MAFLAANFVLINWGIDESELMYFLGRSFVNSLFLLPIIIAINAPRMESFFLIWFFIGVGRFILGEEFSKFATSFSADGFLVGLGILIAKYFLKKRK